MAEELTGSPNDQHDNGESVGGNNEHSQDPVAPEELHKCWQAPDRDSPARSAVDLQFSLELRTEDEGNATLKALLQMDGLNAYDDATVSSVTGQPIRRARRWAKFFANMGLMYRDGQITHLTDWGRYLATAPEEEEKAFRLSVAGMALRVLSKYQLKNPADDPQNRYPADCDVFPYWCIWKAADELEGRVHWDEVNRELMHVMKMAELPAAIDRIRRARLNPAYDPASGGTPEFPLGPRCHDEQNPPPGKTTDGQVRDHYMTPWLKKASFGGLLLTQPGASGNGYWSIPRDLRSELHQAVLFAPEYRIFATNKEWLNYYGSIPELKSETVDARQLSNDDEIWIQFESLVKSGSLAIVLTGPPGTSKTWYAKRLAVKYAGASSRVKHVQFHPSFSYDDFIEGYVPTSSLSNAPSMALFQIVPKTFLAFCDVARTRPQEQFVFVIDEINRGDVSRIFGELLTYIERDYRGKSFTLSYSGHETNIPMNVLLIGTMNPFDRSIAELDDALERRFDRISLEPNISILGTLLSAKGVPGPLIEGIITFFKRANQLMPHGLGHAFFLTLKSQNDLAQLWNHSLRFVFQKAFRFDSSKYDEIKAAYELLVADATLLR